MCFSTTTLAVQCGFALLEWVGRVIWHGVSVKTCNLNYCFQSSSFIQVPKRIVMKGLDLPLWYWNSVRPLDWRECSGMSWPNILFLLWFLGICPTGAPKMEVERQDWDWWQSDVGWRRKDFYTQSPWEVWNQGVVYNGWIGISGL